MEIGNKYQGEITIISVEIKDGFKHESTSFNDKKYSGRYVSHSTEVKCLLINFIDSDGNKGYFFTPSTNISISDGFIYSKYLYKPSPWFNEVKGKIQGHKNILAYEGGTEPSVLIVDSTEIIPSIKNGDIINISGSVKKITKNGLINLYRVKKIIKS